MDRLFIQYLLVVYYILSNFWVSFKTKIKDQNISKYYNGNKCKLKF